MTLAETVTPRCGAVSVGTSTSGGISAGPAFTVNGLNNVVSSAGGFTD